jgi:putative ABC transport system permease protein
MLGMTIGVAAVILLVSVGQAVEAFIVNELTSYGSNWVQVTGTVSNTADMSAVSVNETTMTSWLVPFSESDYEALCDPSRVPSAKKLAAFVTVPLQVRYAGETGDLMVFGVTPSYQEIFNIHSTVGRDLDEHDEQSAARIALLGVDAVDILFAGRYPLGEHIHIGDVDFEVVGVLEDFASVMDQDDNQVILIPITTAWRRLGVAQTVTGEYTITGISAEAIHQDAVDSLATEITQVLREQHKLDTDEKNDFQVVALTDVLDIVQVITGLLTVFLGLIAGISLLVGGIGIMNIMLVTVTERTQEIGLRKALGAQGSDILTQFLTESIVLAFIGGILGTLIAIGFSALLSATIPNLAVHVLLSSILLATVITIVVGGFFGAFPAHRAAKLNPIDALRHE